jgi:glycosyltransferase involved in cell wall biosynthesis
MVTATHTLQTPHTEAARWTGTVALIAKPGGANTGVGRYAQMLHHGLREAGVDAVRSAPVVPPLPGALYAGLRRCGADLRAFFTTYPVWANAPRADVYHLTSQNLASLLLFRRPRGHVVVTVHDIIPYMLRDNPRLCSYRTAADRLFDRLAMLGLKRADALLADSRYTRQSVIEHLGIAPERINVAYLGIDQTRFHPLQQGSGVRDQGSGIGGQGSEQCTASAYIASRSFADHIENVRKRYHLPEKRRFLLYVGSEDPRKNVGALLKGLALVREQMADVALIKVGRPHFLAERQRLLALATQLGVSKAVYFLDDVPEEDLPLLYNLADVYVMPSLYEGFGFPVLEAMACGTPVVCARATSLTELVGDAGVLIDPQHEHELAQAIAAVLTNDALREELSARGVRRAAEFTWQRTINAALDVYCRAFDRLQKQERS